MSILLGDAVNLYLIEHVALKMDSIVRMSVEGEWWRWDVYFLSDCQFAGTVTIKG